MKKFYYLIVLLLVLSSCTERRYRGQIQANMNTNSFEEYWRIDRIDGCQYISAKYSANKFFTHHAACDNEKHYYEKTIN